MSSYLNKVREYISNGDDKTAIDFLDFYCSNNVSNTEANFLLAFLLVNTYVYADGFLTAIDLLKSNLSSDPNDVKSVLLFSYIERVYNGGMREDINELIEICIMREEKNNYKKHLLLLDAEYYFERDNSLCISLLRKSLEEDPEAAYNYIYLGRLIDDKEMFQKGLNNIKTIITATDEEPYDPLNFDRFIDENVRGVRMTYVNYNSLTAEMNSM